jgi:carbamoyltransferase
VDISGEHGRAFTPGLVDLLGPPRIYGAPWALATAEDARFADVAASAQALVEEAMLGLARRARTETGSKNLCLAGGVALNCVANARIAREAGFESVFVQPAAGDAGGALGAAILGALSLGDPRPAALTSAALGQSVDPGRARGLALRLGLTVERPASITDEVAHRLASGQIVACAVGRCELGPRALGQRSLLAPAHHRRFRDMINRSVKGREPFRPFAPSMLLANAPPILPSEPLMTRFMTTVCPIGPNDTAELEATLHVDSTARLHTVDADSDLGLVLAAYGDACGHTALLDTSLNAAGEPIVGSGDDAVLFFVAHPKVDALRVDDLLIERPK